VAALCLRTAIDEQTLLRSRAERLLVPVTSMLSVRCALLRAGYTVHNSREIRIARFAT